MARVKPEALVVCDRSTFNAQFTPAVLDRVTAVTSLREPVWTDELDSAAARSRLAAAEILLTSWGAPVLDATRLAAAPRLRAVFHCAGSVRSLVTDEVWRRGIVVSTAADVNAIPVAEFTLAAVIFAGKRVPFLTALARRSGTGWGHPAGLGDVSNFGRTIGVVGFSRVGRRVVDLVRVLDGSRCLVVDPYADPLRVAAAGASLLPLREVLPRCDVLSLHAPATPRTYHLIGAEELGLLPDHATLINTARGGIVDTGALERECATGRISAILDVTDPEPLPRSSVLYDLPNVMITPHVAGSLGSETHRMVWHALDELRRFLAGEPLLAAVTADDLEISA